MSSSNIGANQTPSVPSSEISSRTLQGVHYIKLPAVVKEHSLATLINIFKDWSKLKVDLHVIDFGKLTEAPVGFFRLIQTFEVQLKLNNLKMLSINIDPKIEEQIHKMSLQQTFNQSREVKREDPKAKKVYSESKHKKTLFKYLINAAHETVQITLNSSLTCDENCLSKVETIPLGEIDLVSFVPVDNDFISVEFRLCSSRPVLEKFAYAMLGKDTVIDDDLLESMAQELLNMIYGHAKSNLNDKEHFQLPSAIPKILRKADLGKIKRSKPPDLIVLPMITPMGTFYVEVDFGSL